MTNFTLSPLVIGGTLTRRSISSNSSSRPATPELELELKHFEFDFEFEASCPRTRTRARTRTVPKARVREGRGRRGEEGQSSSSTSRPATPELELKQFDVELEFEGGRGRAEGREAVGELQFEFEASRHCTPFRTIRVRVRRGAVPVGNSSCSNCSSSGVAGLLPELELKEPPLLRYLTVAAVPRFRLDCNK